MLSKAVSFLICSLLVVPFSMFFVQNVSPDPLVPDPQFDPSLGVDIPTWRVGDYWNYSTSFTVDYLGFDIPFSGWMNMSVAYVTLDFTYSDSPVYITNITGNVSGALKLTFPPIDEKIYIDLSGYMWERIQDLSMYRMVLNATVSGTQSSLNGEYPFGFEYDPPLEQYDFPLIPGEEWLVNVSARAPFGGSGELANLQQNMSCGNMVQRTVPAGTFMTHPVLIEEDPSLFYNRTVGNTVERIFDLEVSGLSQSVPWELEDYYHGPEETRIRIWVDSTEPVWAGSTFDIKGELSSGDTIVNILFPGSQVAATIPLAGSTTTFTRTLTAPWDMDDTPTSFDHASFGIFAVVGMLEEYDVCTVTTKAVDLMVNSSSLMVRHEGAGTKDDNFTAVLEIYNPSNYGVDNVDVQLRYDHGEVVLDRVVPNIEAMSFYSEEVDLGRLDPGNHTLILEVDPMGAIAEYNETNGLMVLEFSVLDRVPLVQISSVTPGDIQASEGEWMNLSAWSFRGDDPIPTGNWTIDGVEEDWDNHLNISLNYVGEMSYREEQYVIIYEPDPDHLFPDEIGTMQWNLTVINVNRAPEITSFSPQEGIIEIEEGQSVNLSVEVNDPDGLDPLLNWTTNNGSSWASTPSVTFFSDHTGRNSSTGSPFIVNVVVTDQEDRSLNVSIKWTIIVLDVDRAPVVNITPPPGRIQVEYNGSLSFAVLVEDPDMDEVNATWFLEGFPFWSGTTLNLSMDNPHITDDNYVALVLHLSIGKFLKQYNWTIQIISPPDPPPPEPVAPTGVVITSPQAGKVFLTNETITFEVEHADARPLTFRWLINGTFYNTRHVTVSDLVPGNYTAVVNITTEGPPPGWLELEVSFSVVAPDGGEAEKEDDKDDPFPWWAIILLIIVGIVISVALILILMGRKRDEYYDEE